MKTTINHSEKRCQNFNKYAFPWQPSKKVFIINNRHLAKLTQIDIFFAEAINVISQEANLEVPRQIPFPSKLIPASEAFSTSRLQTFSPQEPQYQYPSCCMMPPYVSEQHQQFLWENQPWKFFQQALASINHTSPVTVNLFPLDIKDCWRNK